MYDPNSSSYGYYDYLHSEPFQENLLTPMGAMISEIGSCLDVGCGEGWLAEHVQWSVTKPYLGIEASIHAVETARNKYNHTGRSLEFRQARLENFIPENEYDVVVFGGILDVLIKPQWRLPLVRRYVRNANPSHIIVYDLDRLDHKPLDECGWLLRDHDKSFSTVINLPGLQEVKRYRKVLLYKVTA